MFEELCELSLIFSHQPLSVLISFKWIKANPRLLVSIHHLFSAMWLLSLTHHLQTVGAIVGFVYDFLYVVTVSLYPAY